MGLKYGQAANLIEAEITVDALGALVSEPTVEKIESYPIVVSIPDIIDTRFSLSYDTVGKNLKAIKADSAWAAGYDGRGRIVCSFDTGVDGMHPALSGNYRGNKGHSASECWFFTDGVVHPRPRFARGGG